MSPSHVLLGPGLDHVSRCAIPYHTASFYGASLRSDFVYADEGKIRRVYGFAHTPEQVLTWIKVGTLPGGEKP